MLSAEIFRVLYDKDENNENDNDATADAPAVEADDENETAAPAGVIMDDPDNVAEEAVQPPIPDEDTGGGDFDAADDDESNFY